MFVLCVIVSVLLAASLLVSAAGKLTKMDQVVTTLTGVGVPLSWFPWLALAEITGAVGLLVGLGAPAIGVLAAVGVICYFVGAISFHLRAGDRNLAPPGGLLVVAVLALVLRLATA